MTAVEFLIEKICGEHTDAWKEEIKQALEIEKEQICNAYIHSKKRFSAGIEPELLAENYYTETYKNNDNGR